MTKSQRLMKKNGLTGPKKETLEELKLRINNPELFFQLELCQRIFNQELFEVEFDKTPEEEKQVNLF